MYNEKEIQAAVDLYKRIHSLRRVCIILGYPSKNTLEKWIKCLKTTGSIKSLLISKGRRYSEEQILKAVRHCLTQGVSREQAIRDLGYPSRVLLTKWIQRYEPQVIKKTYTPVPPYSQKTKLAAVRAFRMRTKTQTVISIARKFGISRQTLYAWDREFPRPALEEQENIMPPHKEKKDDSSSREELPDQERFDQALDKVHELEKQVEGLSMDAEKLQREIAHLKMQKDILVKCAEVLKKRRGRQS